MIHVDRPSSRLLRRLRGTAGYSLIELCVVLAILGILGGAALSINASKVEREKLSTLRQQFDTIEEALDTFATNNATRLPCPALPKQKENSLAFGRADCTGSPWPLGTVIQGVVPVRTLGLPDRMMYDPWGNRLFYSVVRNMTSSTASTRDNNNETIKIKDDSGIAVNPIDAGTNVSNRKLLVQWLLLSSGPDKMGAFNRTTDGSSLIGALTSAVVGCATSGALEYLNCSTDYTTYRDMPVQPAASTTATNYFYDYLRWKGYRNN